MVKLRRLSSGVFSPSKLVSTHVRDLFGEVLRFNQMQYMIVMLPLPITLATRRFLFYWGNPSWSITCNCYWEGEHRKVSSTEFFGFRPLFSWVYIQYTVPQMPFLTSRWPRASSHFKKWRWTNWVSMICVKKVWQNWAEWTWASGQCRHFGMLKEIRHRAPTIWHRHTSPIEA